MYLKLKLPAFCRLCPRQVGKERMEKSHQEMDLTNWVKFSLCPPLPTKWNNVIYAWNMPLKDAFPPRRGQIRDGIVLRAALSYMCSSLSSQSSPKLDGHAQDKGKLCEGEQNEDQQRWEQRRRGAGKRNAEETSGRVCQAQHTKLCCTSVCRTMQRSGGEEKIKTDTESRTVQRRSIDSQICWVGVQINAPLKLFSKPVGL